MSWTGSVRHSATRGPVKRLSVEISVGDYQSLERHAAAGGTTITALVLGRLQPWLDELPEAVTDDDTDYSRPGVRVA